MEQEIIVRDVLFIVVSLKQFTKTYTVVSLAASSVEGIKECAKAVENQLGEDRNNVVIVYGMAAPGYWDEYIGRVDTLERGK